MSTWMTLIRKALGGRARARRRPALGFERLEGRAVPAAFFVSPLGNDAASGASPAEAWQTVGRATVHDFEPGDWLLFQGGAHFFGTLVFDAGDAGTAASPVTVTSYGMGYATLHSGAGTGIVLANAGGFNVSNLILSGAGPYANSGYGILAANDLPGDVVLEHLYLDNVDVSGYGANGIFVYANNGASGYRDVRVTSARLHDNLWGGLATGGPWYADPSNRAHVIHGLYVGHVYVYDNPGAGNPTSGINLGGVDGGVVERSVVHHNGGGGGVLAGVYVVNSNHVNVQFNESYANRGGSGASHGNGFTFEWGVTHSVMQYNYAHQNDGAGFALWAASLDDPAGASSNLAVRFNVSENDARTYGHGALAVYGGVVNNTEIHNNTVFLKKRQGGGNAAVTVAYWAGTGLHVRNNIFQTTKGAALVDVWRAHWGTDLRFEGNVYFPTGASFRIHWEGTTYRNLSAWRLGVGQEVVHGWATGYDFNPGLKNPGGGGTVGNADLLAGLTAYQLKSRSAARHAGLNLPALFGVNPGPRDFYGNAIPQPTYQSFPIGAATRPGV